MGGTGQLLLLDFDAEAKTAPFSALICHVLQKGLNLAHLVHPVAVDGVPIGDEIALLFPLSERLGRDAEEVSGLLYGHIVFHGEISCFQFTISNKFSMRLSKDSPRKNLINLSKSI